MGKHGTGVPADRLALYERLIEKVDGVEIKGAKSAYTSLNGHMFSFMTGEGALALRLSTEDQQAFMDTYKTGPVIQYGAVMRGYVEIPAALLEDTQSLLPIFEKSVAYVGSLKPNPGKRKSKS
jgi:hypothetical protein